MNGHTNIVYQYPFLFIFTARFDSTNNFTNFTNAFKFIKVFKMFGVPDIINKNLVKNSVTSHKSPRMDRNYQTAFLVYIS